MASFVAHLNAVTPPNVEKPSVTDAMNGMKLGRAFNKLGKHAGRQLTRALPMAIADFVAESFESDAVRGAIASRAVLYTSMGAWSAGSTNVLIGDSAGNDGGAIGQTTYAKGGPAALANALAAAAKAAGAEIRTGADAEVVHVTTVDARATGVVLTGGEEISAGAVISAADPKRTMTSLLDPVVIGPHLRWRAENIRTPGCTAKVNLALSGLPKFNGASDDTALQGRIVVAPSVDYIERAYDAAKYGTISEEPMIEATIPTLADPSLAPAGTHVMSMIVQWAPYKLREGDWAAEGDQLADVVVKTMEQYAPGLGDLVTARQVLTPVDLERDFGLTQGHVLHAEPALDSFFAWRPLLGHARYRFGVDGLWLCGSGAHPGGGITGAPGANAAREFLSAKS
jgi:phytoene dehydrogenase-like protein